MIYENVPLLSTGMAIWMTFLGLLLAFSTYADHLADLEPEFAERITNLTVAEGEEVELPCVVENLGSYRVAWIRVESQTILSIHTHVITRNYRITLNHKDHQHWNLRIANAQEEDRGRYMCQVNTVPMKKQIGYLDVVVPPKFVQSERSTEVLSREGSNVTLSCRVKGHPMPKVTWHREDGQPFTTGQLHAKDSKSSYEGEDLILDKVSRLHMGTYLCTAGNDVPPSVTRRILLYVHFPPMIWIPHQLVGVPKSHSVSLECLVEAFPKSINYWTREDGHLVVSDERHAVTLQENTYKMHMKLTILAMDDEDFGSYHCYAKNSIGSTEGAIRLYETIDMQRTSTPKPDYIDEDESTSSQKSLQIGFRNRKTDERLEMLDDSLSRERNFPNQPPDQTSEDTGGTANGGVRRISSMSVFRLLCTISIIKYALQLLT